jgi:hypothetical protein
VRPKRTCARAGLPRRCAAIVSRRYRRDRLLELASDADGGFDVAMFAHALSALAQITDEAFEEYATPPNTIAALRTRFAEWREELQRSLRDS